MRSVASPDDIARFWSRVDRAGECWLWKAGRNSRGYGAFRVGDRQVLAHRFSYELANGPIPDGLFVCHDCPGGDNPRCVNPAHLFLGTHQDNTDDMMAKGRHWSASGNAGAQPGEANPKAKLSADDVRAIRAAHDAGEGTRSLSRRYGLDITNIRRIVKRELWKHVA